MNEMGASVGSVIPFREVAGRTSLSVEITTLAPISLVIVTMDQLSIGVVTTGSMLPDCVDGTGKVLMMSCMVFSLAPFHEVPETGAEEGQEPGNWDPDLEPLLGFDQEGLHR